MPARPPQRRKSYLDRGQPHELTFGCYHGYRFLERERVCLWLADSITRVKQELGMAVWAYVFMPNHVHLVVHFGNAEVELARALRGIKWPVARKAIAFLRRSAPEWLSKLQA